MGWPKVRLKTRNKVRVISKYSRNDLVGYLGKLVSIIEL
jgi:hypothetical protein